MVQERIIVKKENLEHFALICLSELQVHLALNCLKEGQIIRGNIKIYITPFEKQNHLRVVRLATLTTLLTIFRLTFQVLLLFESMLATGMK